MYRISYWEVRCIIAGYRRRQIEWWEIARQHAFWVMHSGMVDLRKCGITSASDLMALPTDDDEGDDEDTPDDTEVKAMLEHLRELNEQNGK